MPTKNAAGVDSQTIVPKLTTDEYIQMVQEFQESLDQVKDELSGRDIAERGYEFLQSIIRTYVEPFRDVSLHLRGPHYDLCFFYLMREVDAIIYRDSLAAYRIHGATKILSLWVEWSGAMGLERLDDFPDLGGPTDTLIEEYRLADYYPDEFAHNPFDYLNPSVPETEEEDAEEDTEEDTEEDAECDVEVTEIDDLEENPIGSPWSALRSCHVAAAAATKKIRDAFSESILQTAEKNAPRL